ncbi:hypothetical protein GY45DRAFT_1174305 [Cubamyces sp. BRFM 1775]|nr:hypothetical protein GY45DRAFT_1174305 [Cubamyces sp. BRFM 1775]
MSSQLSAACGQSQHHLSTPIVSCTCMRSLGTQGLYYHTRVLTCRPLPLDTPAMRSRRTSAGARRLVGRKGTSQHFLCPSRRLHRRHCASPAARRCRIVHHPFIDVPSASQSTHSPSPAYQKANRCRGILSRRPLLARFSYDSTGDRTRHAGAPATLRNAAQENAQSLELISSAEARSSPSNHLPPVFETDMTDIITSRTLPLGRLAALSPLVPSLRTTRPEGCRWELRGRSQCHRESAV